MKSSSIRHRGTRLYRLDLLIVAFIFLLLGTLVAPADAQQKMVSYEAYDQYGNVLRAKDANGHEIRYYYGTADAPFSQQDNGIYLTGIQRVKGQPDEIPADGSRPTGGDDLFSDAKYNNKGEVVRLRDENGIATHYKYDGFSRLIAILDTKGDTLESYSYVYSVNENAGTFNPNAPNYIETTRHINGYQNNRTSRQYMDGLGRPIQTVTTDGDSLMVTAKEYDQRGREWRNWKAFRVAGTTPSYQPDYDDFARPYYGDEQPFAETRYEASPLNRPLEQLPPGGEEAGTVQTNYGVKTIDSDPLQFTETTDEVGNTSRTFTDGWGRKIRTVAGEGTNKKAATGFEYDAMDQLVKVRHPNYYDQATYPGDWTTTYNYDALGNMIQKSSPDAGTARYAYDRAGNLRFKQDARQDSLDHLWFGRYDELGRLIQSGVGRFDNAVSFSAYRDSTSKTTAVENDKRNWITANSWDRKPNPNNFPWSVFSEEIKSVNLNNTKGQLSASAFRTDPQRTSYVSLQGEMIQGTSSFTATDSITTENTIVAAPGGNLDLTAGRKIVLRSFTRIEEGANFTASIDPKLAPKEGGASVQQAIAAASTYNSDDGATWRLTLHSYDDRGRLSDKWIFTRYQPRANTHIAYEYNKADEVIRKTVRVGEQGENVFTEWMEYDDRGQLTEVYVSESNTKPEAPAITYRYTAGGQVRAKTLGNTTQIYAYNLRGWITEINNSGSGSTPFAASYDYQDNGNIRSSTFFNPMTDLGSDHRSYTYDYSYDSLSRLTDADYRSGGSNPGWFDLSGLQYDRQGNILGLNRNNEAGTAIDQLGYTYNGNNRLQGVTDAHGETAFGWDAESTAFDYDPNGNLTKQTQNGTDSTLFAYDHRNLPLKATLPNGNSLRFRYTADGQRYSKQTSADIYTYVLDGSQTLAVMKDDTLRWWNIAGQGVEGRLDAQSDSLRYYLTDHLGSTRVVVDNNGNVLETFDYYPFGLLMPKRNTAGANTIEKFTGKERDTEGNLNLDYFGARYYDPAIGRWIGIDPYKEKYPGWSSYNYTLDNPINSIDPDGRLVIFINGHHFGDGGSRSYWGNAYQIVREKYTDESTLFYDGSLGGFERLRRNNDVLEPRVRMRAGFEVGMKEAAKIFANLPTGETIKIISHSMGTAYTRGFVYALKRYARKNDIDIDKLLEYELDVAAFDSGHPYLTANVRNTFQAGGDEDEVAGNEDIKGENVIRLTTPDGTTHSITAYDMEDLLRQIKEHLNDDK